MESRHQNNQNINQSNVSSSSTSTSHQYQIRGVTVDFPYSAYECQQVYMEKVIAACQTNTAALLESPTGTGKTLCLLCATLAWKQTYNASQEFNHNMKGVALDQLSSFQQQTLVQLQVGAGNINVTTNAAPNPTTTATGFFTSDSTATKPKIIYSSRTHSQLAKVMAELKNTKYHPKVTLLGSRQQMCVHPTVSQLEGTQQTHACRALVNEHACKYHENIAGNKHIIQHTKCSLQNVYYFILCF
jgi:regulator of telomere elongation helicase 1